MRRPAPGHSRLPDDGLSLGHGLRRPPQVGRSLSKAANCGNDDAFGASAGATQRCDEQRWHDEQRWRDAATHRVQDRRRAQRCEPSPRPIEQLHIAAAYPLGAGLPRGCISNTSGDPHVCQAGTHDISGGIIQSDGTFHTWVGCFMSQYGGGWQHVVSTDLVHWKLQEPFQGQSNQGNEPRKLPCIQAGAVGIDDDGTAFAVESCSDCRDNHSAFLFPYNAYRFTNSSNNAWGQPEILFNYTTNRALPGDPPRPWKDPLVYTARRCPSTAATSRWLPTRRSRAAVRRGGEAKMWSSPALFGARAKLDADAQPAGHKQDRARW